MGKHPADKWYKWSEMKKKIENVERNKVIYFPYVQFMYYLYKITPLKKIQYNITISLGILINSLSVIKICQARSCFVRRCILGPSCRKWLLNHSFRPTANDRPSLHKKGFFKKSSFMFLLAPLYRFSNSPLYSAKSFDTISHSFLRVIGRLD